MTNRVVMGLAATMLMMGVAQAAPQGWSKTHYAGPAQAAKATAAYLFNQGARKAGDRLGSPLVDIVPLQGADFKATLAKRSPSGLRYKINATGNLPHIRFSATVQKFADGWHGKTSASPRIWSDYQE